MDESKRTVGQIKELRCGGEHLRRQLGCALRRRAGQHGVLPMCRVVQTEVLHLLSALRAGPLGAAVGRGQSRCLGGRRKRRRKVAEMGRRRRRSVLSMRDEDGGLGDGSMWFKLNHGSYQEIGYVFMWRSTVGRCSLFNGGVGAVEDEKEETVVAKLELESKVRRSNPRGCCITGWHRPLEQTRRLSLDEPWDLLYNTSIAGYDVCSSVLLHLVHQLPHSTP